MTRDRSKFQQHSGLGPFTIGYLDLSFWRGVFAVVIWPYDIGVAVAALEATAPLR